MARVPRLSLVCVCGLLLILFIPQSSKAQFPGLANAIFGPDSYIYGIKNILGGVLSADAVHNKCVQKSLCNEFSDEVVKLEERYDPVKRSLVRIPKVVQRRGRLRWIGDLLVGGVSKVASRLGINPNTKFRRRQGLPVQPTLAAKAVEFALANWHKIPVQQIFHVMDFAVDATNTMERSGHVYPYVKASSLGYGYGHVRNDDFGGVCGQIAPDCGGWWDHLETVNDYNGGALSRKAEERSDFVGTRSGPAGPSADDPIVWNHLNVRDMVKPKVFVCKAGLFLDKLSVNMGGDSVEKERFGEPEFTDTCNPHTAEDKASDVLDALDVEPGLETAGGEVPLSEIEILDIGRDGEQTTASPFLDTGFGSLPLIVFEGLPEPRQDQTDEQLVESLLQLVNLPQTTVRTAVRLPVRTRGKDVVLVEMDTTKHEDEVLEHKEELRQGAGPSLRSSVKIGIRRARYKELWKYVRELSAVRSYLIDKHKESLSNGQKEPEGGAKEELQVESSQPGDQSTVEVTQTADEEDEEEEAEVIGLTGSENLDDYTEIVTGEEEEEYLDAVIQTSDTDAEDEDDVAILDADASDEDAIISEKENPSSSGATQSQSAPK